MRCLLNERGGLLGFALATALISSITIYAVLFSAISQGRQGRFLKERLRAQYVAEAGLVIAKERLWRDPTYAGGVVPVTDTSGLNSTNVTITVTVPDASGRQQISANVVY